MSDIKTHRNCLNCGTELSGAFCHNCGQKAHLHHDSFRNMIVHFVADYFHYDGKFIRTFKTLITKPGHLTKLYFSFKRAPYLLPAQMYIFISAVFFIVFFSVIKTSSTAHGNRGVSADFTMGSFDTEQQSDEEYLAAYDSLEYDMNMIKEDKLYLDSFIAVTPASLEAGYVMQYFAKLLTDYAIKNKLYRSEDAIAVLIGMFLKSIPKLFFVLMPLLGLLLMVFFNKKGSGLFYVDHVVFSIHFHCFLFISALLGTLATFIRVDNNITSELLFFVVPFAYFVVACRNFYNRSYLATILASAFTFTIYVLAVFVLALANIALVLRFG